MQTILVPTDLSPAAQNAADYAGNLCRQSGAGMLLLHVYMLPIPVSEMPFAMVSAEEIHYASESALALEAERIKKETGIKVDSMARLGLASDEVRELEKEGGIDMVVMGMKGAGGLDKLIGSTTVAVIRKCHKAVLVIPANVTFSPFSLIAYATDFSYQTNDRCFRPLQWLAGEFRAAVYIVHVHKEGTAITTPSGYKEKLEPVLGNIPHSYYIVNDKEIEHGLQQFVQQHSPGMLVMVAHKHTLLERLFGTHHTRLMAYQTHIPLLVLQDKD